GATLRLTTLGGAQLGYTTPDGQSVLLLGAGKPLALLVYLAFSPGRTASREHLIDLLWSDLEPERGKHALRQTAYFLRHHLGEKALHGRQGELELLLPVETDRERFLEAMESGDLECTVALYTGPFLPGFASPGGAEFEHWADLERERLRATFLRAAETLARRRLSTSSFREAQRLARRVRDEDPLNEAGWRLLIETLVSAHDHLAATIEADALTTLLQAEGREPEPATRASLRLARQRPQQDHDDAAPQEGRGRGLIAELVGREREFSAIIRAWDEARRGLARHVHISGAAGLGKTRLLSDVYGRLRAGGATVVSLRASPGDRRVGYALAGELARAVGTLPGAAAISPAAASALIAMHPGLSSQFAGAMDQSTDDEALRRRTMAMSEVLAAVSDEAPLALLVDDLHWADPSSQQLLAGVLERLQGSHVLLVTAARPTRGGLPEAMTTEHLTLAPLSVVQVGELLASLGALPREDWTNSLTQALHTTSGGVPLLVLETLQLALERGSLLLGAEGWQSDDPLYLITELQAGGALRHRIAQLDPADRRLLLALATAGAPLSLARLARVMDRSAEELEGELTTLERRGFVMRSGADWEPVHDQIAEIALDLASIEERRAMHLALGRVLAEDAEAEPLLLPRAGHHLAAAERDDELGPVYARWVAVSERRGDRRDPAALASELLGEHSSPARVDRLVKSLPLWRRAMAPSQRAAWAAAAAILVGVVGVGGLYLPRGSLPDARLLAFYAGPGDTAVVASLPIDRNVLEESGPIDVATAQETARLPHWSRFLSPVATSPDGKQLAYALSTPDSGVVDVFVQPVDRAPERLTVAPREDNQPDWSPDGRHIVLTTSRWAPRGADDADLAVMDPATRRVRQLTSGRPYDFDPHWSPDGTRIAFARRHFTLWPSQFCWTGVDGRAGRCFAPPGYEVVSILGWTDEAHVAAVVDSVDRQLLLTVDMDRGLTRVVDPGPVNQATLSEDGQWIACFCQRGGDAAVPAWYVYPLADPDHARRLTRSGGDGRFSLGWGGRARRPPFVDRIRILAPRDSIPVDAAYRLRVEGRDENGDPIPIPPTTLRWRSVDTTIATIDSVTGALHPRRAGAALLLVSAGGWREDSANVLIGAPGSRVRLAENWLDGAARRWVLFGDPAPSVVLGPGRQPALANNGDGTFTSGVYSREVFDAHRGLGLEVRLSTPITAPQRQFIRVGLTAALDSATLAVMDLRTGGGLLPKTPYAEQVACAVSYPGGDGPSTRERFLLSSAGLQRRVPADQATPDGGWYAIRIQIFPDGTCGFAAAGRPLYHSEAAVPTTQRFRVLIQGNSVDTQILAGPVEVWEGVRGDVDWTALER
ncbi:MAG TPA: AAA family ATPase, partial [Gemmatimonadales bacterium]|nr:AAA family ATPase [Gemmatimonadales bacterium]